jgi:hypothetical protein
VTGLLGPGCSRPTLSGSDIVLRLSVATKEDSNQRRATLLQREEPGTIGRVTPLRNRWWSTAAAPFAAPGLRRMRSRTSNARSRAIAFDGMTGVRKGVPVSVISHTAQFDPTDAPARILAELACPACGYQDRHAHHVITDNKIRIFCDCCGAFITIALSAEQADAILRSSATRSAVQRL